MRSNQEKQSGFIAQEVREVIPEVVSETEGDFKKGETLGISSIFAKKILAPPSARNRGCRKALSPIPVDTYQWVF